MSPFALPPCITAAAADGLENSASFVKTQQPVSLDEGTVGNELLALGDDVTIALGRWTLLKNGG
jgi:hypothetical protein